MIGIKKGARKRPITSRLLRPCTSPPVLSTLMATRICKDCLVDSRRRSAAQPSKKQDDQECRHERPPPRVEAERAQRGRSAFDERHDCARPGKSADEIQRTELQRRDASVCAGDRNRCAQSRQETADKHESGLMAALREADISHSSAALTAFGASRRNENVMYMKRLSPATASISHRGPGAATQ